MCSDAVGSERWGAAAAAPSATMDGRLCSVGVQHDAPFAGQAGDLANRLNRTHFIVRMHHGDERRLRAQRLLQVLERDPPETIDGHDRHVPALLTQEHGRRHHGQVLDRADHEMAPGHAERARHAEQRLVVRLGGAAGEDDLLRLSADQVGNLMPCLRDGLRGAATPGVRARRGAELITQPGKHRVEHFGCHRRGGVVVEMDGVAHRSSF